MRKHPAGNLDRKVGVGKRFLAVLIDGILIGIVLAILSFVAVGGAATDPGGPGAEILAVQVLSLVISFGYWIVMEAVYGYTIGKLALGIVVKTEDGGDIDWADSAIRNVLRIVDALPTLYILGAILVLVTDDNQRVGDIAANTVVVETA